MKRMLLIGIVLAAAISGCGEQGQSAAVRERTVTIRGPDTFAQMFDEGGAIVARIPNGTECAVLGSYTLTEAGVEIPLYELDCGGQIGFVNRRWTR